MRLEHWLYMMPLRLRSLFRWAQADQELDDELLDHLERKTEEYMAQGMTQEEAHRRARIDLEGIEQTKEKCRDARRVNWIQHLIQDIRYALRGFRRAPLFVISVVATIALGLGINTALFTIPNAYYFRPMDVRDPRSLYDVVWQDRAGAMHDFSWPEYQSFLTENPSFSDAIAYQTTEARMNDRNAFGLLVTGDYFRVLGVDAALGRTLLPEDAAVPGREAVVVLSAVAWQTRFAGDPQIVGKEIIIRGYPFIVVGVARPGFRGLGGRPADFWAPLTESAQLQMGPDLFGPEMPRSVSILGRLRAETGLSQARASVAVWMQRATANAPLQERALQAILNSRATYKPWNPSNLLMFCPILVAFSLVLLIGCANVANMILARSLSRQREFGIRVSLGASRRRLIQQLLTESTLLAIPAAAAGFLVAQLFVALCMRVLFATLPPGIADVANRLPVLSLDIRVFVYNLGAAFVAALLFGLFPAMQATRRDVLQVIRGDFTGTARPARLRDGLVLAQVTVCVVLLITTGVLLRGVNAIKRLDNALSRRDTIEIRVNEKLRARIIERISSDPSVEVLAAATESPALRKQTLTFKADRGDAAFPIAVNRVSPEYFTLFGLPILLGRNFTPEEARSGAAVAVISDTTAKLLWPKQVAVGRSLSILPDPRSTQTALAATVIGVARDDITRWITGGDDKTLVYFPTAPQSPANILFVATHGDVETARRRLDSQLSTIDPAAVEEMRRFQIQEYVAEEAYSFRIAYWLSLAIGILALLLTLSGIYGVVAFVVSQRTKEIGIRMALGATTTAVSGLVLKQSIRLALLGTLAGGLLAAGISKILASSLVMINTFDGAAYVSGAFVVLVAASSAAYLPSRRALRVDPIVALRYE